MFILVTWKNIDGVTDKRYRLKKKEIESQGGFIFRPVFVWYIGMLFFEKVNSSAFYPPWNNICSLISIENHQFPFKIKSYGNFITVIRSVTKFFSNKNFLMLWRCYTNDSYCNSILLIVKKKKTEFHYSRNVFVMTPPSRDREKKVIRPDNPNNSIHKKKKM